VAAGKSALRNLVFDIKHIGGPTPIPAEVDQIALRNIIGASRTFFFRAHSLRTVGS
jgi:hypothetical protein